MQNRDRAEGLLDSFSDPLADRITCLTGGPRVECGTSGPRIILRHVRSNVERPTGSNEVAGVVALIAAERDAAAARQSVRQPS